MCHWSRWSRNSSELEIAQVRYRYQEDKRQKLIALIHQTIENNLCEKCNGAIHQPKLLYSQLSLNPKLETLKSVPVDLKNGYSTPSKTIDTMTERRQNSESKTCKNWFAAGSTQPGSSQKLKFTRSSRSMMNMRSLCKESFSKVSTWRYSKPIYTCFAIPN